MAPPRFGSKDPFIRRNGTDARTSVVLELRNFKDITRELNAFNNVRSTRKDFRIVDANATLD